MYSKQLVEIHDRWYRDFPKNAAHHVRDVLKLKDIVISDLGCGPGIFLEEFYPEQKLAYGYDLSIDMINLCKAKMPEYHFEAGSIFELDIQKSDLVTMIGEVLNYAAMDEAYEAKISQLFQTIYKALNDNGYFLFDCIVESNNSFNYEHFHNEAEYTVHMQSRKLDDIIQREILTFLKAGTYYEKSEEIHRLRILSRNMISNALHAAGFQVEISPKYGDYPLLPGRIVFVAKK